MFATASIFKKSGNFLSSSKPLKLLLPSLLFPFVAFQGFYAVDKIVPNLYFILSNGKYVWVCSEGGAELRNY